MEDKQTCIPVFACHFCTLLRGKGDTEDRMEGRECCELFSEGNKNVYVEKIFSSNNRESM